MQLVNSTIEDVCQKEDTSYDVVLGTIERWMTTGFDWEVLPPFTVLGIDEIALKKGHRDYIVIVTARLSTGRLIVLAVLPDRTKATLVTWLTNMPARLRDPIQTVCTDLWDAYVTAVREVMPHTTIVIDRFHVAKHYRDGADTLRKQACKRLQAELPPETRAQLKHTMWPFRKPPSDLKPDEQDRLMRLFEHAPQLKQAYDLREQLTMIFDTARSKAEGLRHIHRWRRVVEASGLMCFNPFRKLLDTWLDLIANDFRQHQTSGFVEGLNNQLKVLKRRCFGIYHLRHLFQRITLDLDGYRRVSPWQGARQSIWVLPRQVQESPKSSTKEAQVVADSCRAIRTVMRDDAKYPLEPPGLQLYQKLPLMAASVERVMALPPSALLKRLSRMLAVWHRFQEEFAQLVMLFSWIDPIAHLLDAETSCEEAPSPLRTFVTNRRQSCRYDELLHWVA
jgi:transposase